MDADDVAEMANNGGFESIETHISWVLLGEKLAYKIKKPVKFSFLDFSTLEKRKFLCEEEVRLNRRLAPDIYLGVVPVVRSNGKFALEGQGEAVDYAVKMRRLPQESRMDALLSQERVLREQVEKIADMVAEFHSRVDVVRDPRYGSASVVKRQIDDLGEFRGVVEEACGLGDDVDFVLSQSDGFIESNAALFARRQEGGMVRDCHGDLHSANIFIGDKITIFDCIEFSEDFRFVDVASEIAFMAMDLDAFGREDLSEAFVERYLSRTGDAGLPPLLGLYKCYRANVRAKIAAIDYSQRPGPEPAARIRKYMALAKRYAGRL